MKLLCQYAHYSCLFATIPRRVPWWEKNQFYGGSDSHRHPLRETEAVTFQLARHKEMCIPLMKCVASYCIVALFCIFEMLNTITLRDNTASLTQRNAYPPTHRQ